MATLRPEGAPPGAVPLFTDSRTRLSGLFTLSSELFFFLSIYTYMSIFAVYAVSLGASATLTGLAVGIFGIGQVFLRIPLGILSDRLARRREIIAGGLLVLGLSDIGMAMAATPWHLVFFRATTSIGASVFVVLAVLFSQQCSPTRRGTAMGLLTGMSGVATLLGAWLGGRVSEVAGYRAAFLWAAGFAALGVLAILAVREKRVPVQARLSLRRLARLAVDPTMLGVSWACVFAIIAHFGATYTLMPLYAAGACGFTKGMLGNLQSLNLGVGALVSFLAGPLADRWGRRNLAWAGLVVLALVLAAIPLLTGGGCSASGPDPAAAVRLFVLSAGIGLAWGFVFPSIMAMGVSLGEGPEQATATGVFMAWYAVGMFLGPQLSGSVLDLAGYSAAFITLAVAGLAGAALILRLGPRATAAPAPGRASR